MSEVKVLVVDDASFIRDLVKKCLRTAFPGIVIEEAMNGRRALQCLSNQTFDLILCDWEMPEMSGLEVLVWLRQQPTHAHTPFIMVTSRGDKENVIQAIQAGVSDYVGKPFTNEQLLTKVKKALSKSGRLQALVKTSRTSQSAGMAMDSVAALTGQRPPVKPTAPVRPATPAAAGLLAPARSTGASNPAASPGRQQGCLRMPQAELSCVVKALSLKDAVLVVKRTDDLPQILDSVVLDLEQGDNAEVARLNAYIHSISAIDASVDTQWLQVHCRFVDNDPQKLDYISRLIARGTTQKHFTPGA